MTINADPGPIAVVGRTGSRTRADAWVLALASQGISSSLFRAEDDWAVAVDESAARRAGLTLAAYERENASVAPPFAAGAPSWRASLVGAALTMLVLTGAHFFSEGHPARNSWLGAGSANANAMLDGELYRAVTALTLHADAGHVLANAIVGAIFLTALFTRTGVGVGLAITVASGSLANLANAALQGPPHDGIGFSGAVFASVGALAGIALRAGGPRRAPWALIFASALTLAALFGTGETTDVLGHFLGFASGLGLGLACAWGALSHRNDSPVQWLAGSAALGLLALSWWLALGG